MKQCAICSCGIDHLKEPAILFIGRYSHHYELCEVCEAATERFIMPENEEARKEAADELYDRFFRINTDRKSAEMLDYMKNLFDEGSETLAQAREALEEYRESENTLEQESDVTPESEELPEQTPAETKENEISEEEFLAQQNKKTPLAVKLLFLLLFLAIGGGAIAYGIVSSSTFTIVAGAMIALLGAASVFTKD